MSASEVVTRFAPSPTGFLHIGGARTALFNWLYARRHGGRFLLRIEDTDKARSTQAAIDAILDGMKWLGLDWDGEVHFQSEYAPRHAEVAQALLASGHAYRCWMSQEELAAGREAAKAERRPFRTRSPWRDREDGPDAPFVIRLKAPREGETIIDDEVQGRVTVKNEELDDFVLLRSDGSPTYMLAVVVDDHDMGVTHVIRGDDHLNNAFPACHHPRHGWPSRFTPCAADPRIGWQQSSPSGTARSASIPIATSRHVAEALFNYLRRPAGAMRRRDHLARPGRAWFDIDAVGNRRRASISRAREPQRPLFARGGSGALAALSRRARAPAKVARPAMPVLTPRAKDLNEVAQGASFLFKSVPLDMDEKAASLLAGDARDLLGRVRLSLAQLGEWTAEATEQAVREVAEASGVKLGQVAQPLRAALTGRATSPGIFDVLALLGRDESLARIAGAENGKD